MAEVVTIEDSPKRNDAPVKEPEKSRKVKCGEDVAISPSVMAKIRKMERTSSSNTFGSFFALSASANNLLPGKPVTLSKDAGKKTNVEKEHKTDDKNTDDSHEIKKSDKSRTEKDERGEQKDWMKEKKDDDEFYCELCDAQANSYLTFETHVQGKKHQKKLAASLTDMERMRMDMRREQFKTDEGPPIRSVVKWGTTAKMQSKVDITDGPIIGLDYICEIWRLDPELEAVYFCKLCDSTCQPNTIVSHILGYRHRLCYLKENAPAIYERVRNMSCKKSELSKILEDHASKMESMNGRGKLRVEQEVDGEPSPDYFERDRFPQEEERPRHFRQNPREQSFDRESPFNREPYFGREPPFDGPMLTEPQIENIKLYPSSLRMEILKELVDIDPQEIRNVMDASRLQDIIDNFKQSLNDFQLKPTENFNCPPEARNLGCPIPNINQPNFGGTNYGQPASDLSPRYQPGDDDGGRFDAEGEQRMILQSRGPSFGNPPSGSSFGGDDYNSWRPFVDPQSGNYWR